MKKVLNLLFFTLFSICTLLHAKEQKIRVLLEKNVSDALLEVKGSYYIFDPFDKARISSGLLGKRFLIRPTSSGIKWGEEFVDIHQIHIKPKKKNSSILVNGIQYDGDILIYKVGKKVNIVNEVLIEDYVKSTLTSEFTYPLEKEVMAAVAIAARTTAYYHINKNKNSFWHVAKDENNYLGSALIIPESFICSAVDATTNMILVNGQKGLNKPFTATWTEHSAGKTAPYHLIFRKDNLAPKYAVEAPHAQVDRMESRWSYTISRYHFENIFKIKNLKSIELFSDQKTAKTYGIRMFDTANDKKDFSFISVQDKLGKNNLKSNDMRVEIKGSDIIFSGYGKGLSVGICLHSASAMAQNGEIAIKILSKFYPETYLINLTAIPNWEKKITDAPNIKKASQKL